ncbi:MAG: ABC transporter permease, partial [Steroidobacteraceae bacterium]
MLRHPAQLALALVGLSLGVATIIAVDIATASSRRAFELSMDAVNGAATHEIVGGPQGIDEALYVDLRTRDILPGQLQPALAPIVEGYVMIGEREMQLVGIDPLASRELGPGGGRGAALSVGMGDAGAAPAAVGGPKRAANGGADAREKDRLEALRKWLTERGAVVMAADAAQQLGIAVNQRFEVAVGGVRHPAVLIDEIRAESAAYDALLLTDIAQAQEWLGRVGKLSRIDVRVPEGHLGEAWLARLRERLPPGVQLQDAHGRTRESLDMTGAFTTNLKAMSLLALLVSTLLIYGAISFAVVQRRRVIGILRALGATRAEVLTIVLTEAAALGVVGAGLGFLLGLAIGRELITLVSQTINDLYFVVAVSETTLPVSSVVKALLGGFGTALAAALLPALEVAGSAPQLGLRRSVLESRAVHISRRLISVSAVLAASAGMVVLVSGRSLLAGFVALFMLLLSVAAITPAVLRGLARAAASVAG